MLGYIVFSLTFRDLCLIPGILQIRPYDPAQLREVDSRSFAKKQVTSELLFQELDCPRQRRLGHVAFSGRLREAQMLAYRNRVPDLVHFHGAKSRRTGALLF